MHSFEFAKQLKDMHSSELAIVGFPCKEKKKDTHSNWGGLNGIRDKENLKDMHSFEFAILGFPCEFNLYSHLLHRLPNH